LVCKYKLRYPFSSLPFPFGYNKRCLKIKVH
jgi:hypothetical protein